jgi:polyhydroxybutyrate depolymerase
VNIQSMRSALNSRWLGLPVALVLIACNGSSTAQAPTSTPSSLETSTQSPAQTSTQSPAQHGTVKVAGVLRTYRLFVPSTLDAGRPNPLVVILHPCPNSADEAAAGSHLDDQATAGRFVVVYPDGSNGCWNAGTCCAAADDVSFISQLIDRLSAQLQIDKARVFVAGFSFGASITYRLACELSNKIAAIAAVSGSLFFAHCHPARPVSVLMMQGTADDVFPYQGGGQYRVPAVATVARMWATP